MHAQTIRALFTLSTDMHDAHCSLVALADQIGFVEDPAARKARRLIRRAVALAMQASNLLCPLIDEAEAALDALEPV